MLTPQNVQVIVASKDEAQRIWNQIQQSVGLHIGMMESYAQLSLLGASPEVLTGFRDRLNTLIIHAKSAGGICQGIR